MKKTTPTLPLLLTCLISLVFAVSLSHADDLADQQIILDILERRIFVHTGEPMPPREANYDVATRGLIKAIVQIKDPEIRAAIEAGVAAYQAELLRWARQSGRDSDRASALHRDGEKAVREAFAAGKQSR